MCNYEKTKIKATKQLLHQKNQVISMRGEFYGNELNKAFVAYLLGGFPNQ